MPLMTLARVSAVCALALGTAIVAVPNTASAETLIRLAHTLNPTDARHIGAERFEELVEDRSGGEIQVEVYPSSQLGGQSEIFEGMTLGLIEMNIAGSTHLSRLEPAFGVFDLPSLAPDEASFMEILDGDIGQSLLDMLPEVGIRGLGYSEVGFRHLYTNKPVEGIEDIDGLVVRVPGNPVYQDTLATFGADPTSMALGEVFTALQQGAIEGAENLLSFYKNSGHWEAAPYVALTYHAALPSVWMISDSFYQSLSPEDQELIKAAASEAAMYEREVSAEMTIAAMQELPGLGVTITEVDLAPFADLAPQVHERHRERIGEDLMSSVDAAMN
ncbi:MAG: TRAP transporter substrate-binding protein [Pseudomonadota bacterium]